MRAVRLLAAWAGLALAACAPTPSPGVKDASAAQAATAQPAKRAPAPNAGARSGNEVATPAASPTPERLREPEAAPAPAPRADAAASNAAPSLACETDSDCAVKDVGSCCGYRPACVRADAETFPEQVKARCAAEGRMGICGFEPVTGCQCTVGKCAARTEAIGPNPPRELR
jgi:hypothetical protein